MRGAFGGHFEWQVEYLVNLDDVLKGSNIALCEAVVIPNSMQQENLIL